jgi:hypothetical protein
MDNGRRDILFPHIEHILPRDNVLHPYVSIVLKPLSDFLHRRVDGCRPHPADAIGVYVFPIV